MLIGRVMTWMRFVRTSAVSLMSPTMIDPSEGPPPPGPRAGRPAGVVGFSKIFSSFASTSVASARCSRRNSETTDADGTSFSAMILNSPRMTSVLSVTKSACARGSGTTDV